MISSMVIEARRYSPRMDAVQSGSQVIGPVRGHCGGSVPLLEAFSDQVSQLFELRVGEGHRRGA